MIDESIQLSFLFGHLGVGQYYILVNSNLKNELWARRAYLNSLFWRTSSKLKSDSLIILI